MRMTEQLRGDDPIFLSISLETQLEDPVERLLAIHARSRVAKEIAAQVRATNVQAMGLSITSRRELTLHPTGHRTGRRAGM